MSGRRINLGAPAALGANGVLRFTTCGAVDDGKSTLLGRLIVDAGAVYEDHLAAVAKASMARRPLGEGLDYSLLFDGLEAEREQGITIDVAYRFFTTANRKYIVADAPGHEDHTRNMATAASNADLCILLVDAAKGISPQTLRHMRIAALVGVRHAVIAVNKMDLVGFGEAVFARLAQDMRQRCAALGFVSITTIPLCATSGDNVVHRSPSTPWHKGPTLFEHLEQVDGADVAIAAPFRLPVQLVARTAEGGRLYQGRIASGRIQPGDEIRIPHGNRTARVARLMSIDGDLPEALAGDSVAVALDAELDIARGDLLCGQGPSPLLTTALKVDLIGFSEHGVVKGRRYLLQCGAKTVTAHVKAFGARERFDPTQPPLTSDPSADLGLNEIGEATLVCVEPLAFDAFSDNRFTGSFILVDRATADTVAAGVLRGAAIEGQGVTQQAMAVTKASRVAMHGHKPAILWFTGLSGAGKSTIADLVEQKLHARGAHTYNLDGDNLRLGLMADLGFSPADRVENIRRAGEVAKLFVDAGLIVTCSFISPYAAERDAVRDLVAPGEFFEIYVDTPLEVCAARDPKGLYRRAYSGEIKGFTGVDAPYEAPQAPELVLSSATQTADILADAVIQRLLDAGVIF